MLSDIEEAHKIAEFNETAKILAEKLAQSYPNLKIIFVSGYPDETIADHGVLDRKVVFLQKPFTSTLLARKVRATLDT